MKIIKIIKKVLYAFLVLICMCVLFYALNLISYSIPNKKIRKNIDESLIIMEHEGLYYNPTVSYYGLFQGHMYDNFTDDLILTVSYNSRANDVNIIKRSVANYICDEYDPLNCLRHVTWNDTKPENEYSRYWFGTSSFIRFLFLVFNYQEIRYLNIACMLLLSVIFIIKLSKEKSAFYSIAFALAFLSIGITTIPFSLQYSPNMYMVLICSLIVLYLYKKEWFRDNVYYLFIMIGAFTAYFDLLTYPLLTFGIPFIIWLILSDDSIKDKIIKSVLCGVSWLFSYSFVFLYKFTLSSTILNKNILLSSFKQVGVRVGEVQEYSKFGVIKLNYMYIFNKLSIIMITIYYIANAFLYLYNRVIKKRKIAINYINLILLVGIGILPMAWYYILSNHSGIHNWMTYRISVLSMISLLLIPLECFSLKKNINKLKVK